MPALPTIINSILRYAEGCKSQEKLMDYLREVNFQFINYSTLRIWRRDSFLKIRLKKKHKYYSFFIRETKHKQGARSRYDSSLIFAFKLDGQKVNKIQVYYKGEYLRTIKIFWADMADLNFKKMVIRLAFPEYLNYVERRQWRVEHLKHEKFPGKYFPTKFYLQHKEVILEMSGKLQPS